MITVKNSHIEISDYNLGDCPRLERAFSLWNPTTFSYYFLALHYNEDKKILYVPRGVDVIWLERLFNTQAVYDRRPDKYNTINPSLMRYAPKNEKQSEVLSFLLSKGKYSNNRRYSQLGVHLNTGFGKTYCVIAASTLMKCRMGIMMYKSDWIEQWYNFILEYTDTKPNEIYIIQGKLSIMKILNRDISNYKYFIMSLPTIVQYGESDGWDKVSELFIHLSIGVKVYDEAHLLFDAISKIDAYTNTRLTIYVTATPMKSSEDESRIYSNYMKNVPGIELFDKEEDARTHYVRVEYNTRPSPVDISNCRNKYGFDMNAYCDYIITKENYYNLLRIFINIAMKSNGKSIIYIGKIHSIDYTLEWLNSEYPEIDFGVYHSKIYNKEAQLNKKIILSTLKSLGTAKDIDGLKSVFILAEPYGSEVISLQTFGRPRSYNTYCFEAFDIGFMAIRNYANKKANAIRNRALSYSTVKFTQNELDRKVSSIMRDRAQYIQLRKNISPRAIEIFEFIEKEK